MKKKYRLKKSAITILVIFIFLIALTIIFSIFSTKSYSTEYSIFEYDISENYDKEKKVYYFEIIRDELIYPFIYKSEYQKDRKLIKDIKEYKEDDYICLTIHSSIVNTTPLCSYKKQLIDYHLVPETIKEKISTYLKQPFQTEIKESNYEIYNTEDNLFIWAYKGFNYINNGKIKLIKFFEEDIYEIPLATKINNLLFIPDYEQKYNFNKVYIINLDTLEVDEWKLKYEISYDSYVAGTNDISIYIIDKKNKIEYELVPERKKMRILATKSQQATIYENGIARKEPMSKLVTKEQYFNYRGYYNYIVENDTLYMTHLDNTIKTKVSEQKITSLVYTYDDNAYYLVNDTLYRYNLKYGETKLMKYSEWSINYKNLIFIKD